MASRFEFLERGRWLWMVVGATLVVALFGNRLQLGDGTLTDPFHHGEYFAALTTLLAGEDAVQPLTLHGALDYLPGLIALRLFGPSSHFLPTRIIFELLSALAAVLLLAIAAGFFPRRPGWKKAGFLVGLALAAPFLVGYRDMVLLAGLFLYFRIQRPQAEHLRRLFEVLFGVVTAFGLFWSFDRGIAGAVAMGSASLLLAWKEGRYRIALGTFAVATAVLSLAGPLFSVGNYVETLRVLSATAGQWSYGWQNAAVVLTLLITLFNALVLWMIWASLRQGEWTMVRAANALLLTLLGLFLLKIATNRADPFHVAMGMWVPLLAVASLQGYGEFRAPRHWGGIALLLLAASWAVNPAGWMPVAAAMTVALGAALHPGARGRLGAALTAALLLFPAVTSLNRIVNGVQGDRYLWLGRLAALPANEALSAEGVRWAAREIAASGSRCLFDFSNSGLLNGLAALPACSRFVYPVYADQRYESELIEAVSRGAPKAIVYSATTWNFRIDGRPMPERFPELNRFLLSRYGQERCFSGYCVRYASDDHG